MSVYDHIYCHAWASVRRVAPRIIDRVPHLAGYQILALELLAGDATGEWHAGGITYRGQIYDVLAELLWSHRDHIAPILEEAA